MSYTQYGTRTRSYDVGKKFDTWGHSLVICGEPGNPNARHVCDKCTRKRFERDMTPTQRCGKNNYKTWRIWECKDCSSGRKVKEVGAYD